MKALFFTSLFGVIPVFLGFVLNIIISRFLQDGYFNLFWDFVFSLGFLMVQCLPGSCENPNHRLFGIVVWPIAVSLLSLGVGVWVWLSGSPRGKSRAIWCLVATSLTTMPNSWYYYVFPEPFIPSYGEILFQLTWYVF